MLDPKIETFLKVTELKSYTAAAEALHLTQPAVTQHIRKLEEYYGCKLIDSSRRSVVLTEAGKMLSRYLTLQRANERQFLGKLRGLSRPLKIGATLSIADYYLPDLLLQSLLEGREVFSVTVENTEHLVAKLERGELDCAFIEGLFDAGLYESRVCYEARFLPIAAGDHPLAGRQAALEELHAYPLALREEGSGTRELLENYLYWQNDSPRSFARVMELGSFVLLKQLVERSQAVSFVYEAVAKKEIERGALCFLDIRGCHLVHPLHFIYRKGSALKKIYEEFYEALLGE